MGKKPSQIRRPDSGTVMIEFALVFPVFVCFVLAFIDLTRVIAVQGLLTYAAEEAMQDALVMPNTDVDVRTADPASPDYRRFVLARQRLIQGSTKFLLQTSLLTASGTPSSAQLVQFTYEDPAPPGGTAPPPFSADVALLRPAERVRVGDPASTTYLDNVSYPYPGPGVSEPSMGRLLQTQPVVVEFRARVHAYTPFLGDIVTRGVAQGFRQPIPRSPLPDEDPSIAAATVWPSPTPNPTAYPYPDPTAVPTPGGCQLDAIAYANCKNSPRGASLPDLSQPGPGRCTGCLFVSPLGP